MVIQIKECKEILEGGKEVYLICCCEQEYGEMIGG